MDLRIGILTSGGDCPGLNAAVRAVGKACFQLCRTQLVGFLHGFHGLVFDRWVPLNEERLSGILATGGTIIGTSRDKPHRIVHEGSEQDMTGAAVETYRRHKLHALVCLGGGGTQKHALRLVKLGLNIVTLPKTIDNDLPFTDVSVGFDTALNIATDAIDRLHSTATSHNRIMVVETMGHRSGWLALGAGLAGGADTILIPELPYSTKVVAEAIRKRTRAGKRFSIIAVAEGAMSTADARHIERLVKQRDAATTKKERRELSNQMAAFHAEHVSHTVKLTRTLETMTGQEARLTILGHLQRGGAPTPTDRVLATLLGNACAETLRQKHYGVMLAIQNERVVPVPIEDVAGRKKLVTPDHLWVKSARAVGTCMGDDRE